jgi:glutathione S-transferase
MRLYQIPFSHNCRKARHVLDLKGIEYEAVNINPALRGFSYTWRSATPSPRSCPMTPRTAQSAWS